MSRTPQPENLPPEGGVPPLSGGSRRPSQQPSRQGSRPVTPTSAALAPTETASPNISLGNQQPPPRPESRSSQQLDKQETQPFPTTASRGGSRPPSVAPPGGDGDTLSQSAAPDAPYASSMPGDGTADSSGVFSPSAGRRGRDKDVKVCGATVYRREKKREDRGDGKLKTRIYWVPEGKSMRDRHLVYQEKRVDGDNGVMYVRLDGESKVWHLPDVGDTKAEAEASAAAQVQEEEESTGVFTYKKMDRVGEMEEWKEDKVMKSECAKYAKRKAKEKIRTGAIDEDHANVLAHNVSRTYMSMFRAWGPEGEEWIDAKVQEEFESYCERKEHFEAAIKQREQSRAAVDAADGEAAGFRGGGMLPNAPGRDHVYPSSYFLARAHYLLDPYYTMRVDHPNSRRTAAEMTLENTAFYQPGQGEIRVLCAMSVMVTHPTEKTPAECVAAVVGDWTGAFAVMFVEPPASNAYSGILAAYPMLEHVDSEGKGPANVRIHIDNNQLEMNFRSPDAVTYFVDSMRIAMCAMYGSGNNEEHIIAMRARSIELSATDLTSFPVYRKVPNAITTLREAMHEHKQGFEQDGVFFALRLCCRDPEARDAVLREWVRVVDEGTIQKKKSSAMLNNALRVLDEAIRHPMYHEDGALFENLQSRILALKNDIQNQQVRTHLELQRSALRIIDKVMGSWTGREVHPDRPFPACFQPTPDSAAAREEEAQDQLRMQAYSATQVPPGFYLALVVTCGSQVLVSEEGNLVCEPIMAQPSQKELEAFTADHPDFQWLMQFGGATSGWANRIARWSELYDNVGTSLFRAKILRAVRALRELFQLQDLGCLFDVPIIQHKVRCGYIVTVLNLDSPDDLRDTKGHVWKPMNLVEGEVYVKALTASRNARLEFLSTKPSNCVRFIKAARDFADSGNKALTPGFYIGHLVLLNHAAGYRVLVPENNRGLIPLSKVSEEMPSLETWRWMQSLNERKKRTGSFGLDPLLSTVQWNSLDADCVTYRHKFVRAMLELEHAIGTDITTFYDLEVVNLDEQQRMKALVAVKMVQLPPQSQGALSGELSTGLGGPVPMCWKPLNNIEMVYASQYFPKLWGVFSEAIHADFRRAYSTCQPYTTDEAERLNHECVVTYLHEVDKYWFLVSWLRQISMWGDVDGRHLVEAYEGGAEHAVARSVEEAVEVSASNYTACEDINYRTMRSLMFEAAATPSMSLNWSGLYGKLREINRVMTLGYSQRTGEGYHPVGLKKAALTYDEMYRDGVSDGDDEYDDDREPTTYNVECTIDEFVFSEAQDGQTYFTMRDLVQDIVDEAAVDAVDVGDVRDIGKAISDMISVIETTDDITENATLYALKNEVRDTAIEQRQAFQDKWLDVYRGVEGDGADRSFNPRNTFADEDDDDDADEGGSGAVAPPLFYDGSDKHIKSFDEGVHFLMARAANTNAMMEQVMRVAASAQDALELQQSIDSYKALEEERLALRGAHNSSTGEAAARAIQAAASASKSAAAVHDTSGGQSVVVVSSDYVEFGVEKPDPLRCLVLQGVEGKVRFPAIRSSSLGVLVAHLALSDNQLSSFLASLPAAQHKSRDQLELLLEMSLSTKAPLLLLRFIVLLYGTPSGSRTYFNDTDAANVRQLVQGSFLFQLGIRDWLELERLGGDSINPAFDLLWWLRYLFEATGESVAAGTSSVEVQQMRQPTEAYSHHQGQWKQMYAEARIKVFLVIGVQSLSRDEVRLWSECIGKYVEYLTMRDTHIGDGEIEVLAAACPNLVSLDLSYTNVTDAAVASLLQCKKMRECVTTGCNMSSDGQAAVARNCRSVGDATQS